MLRKANFADERVAARWALDHLSEAQLRTLRPRAKFPKARASHTAKKRCENALTDALRTAGVCGVHRSVREFECVPKTCQVGGQATRTTMPLLIEKLEARVKEWSGQQLLLHYSSHAVGRLNNLAIYRRVLCHRLVRLPLSRA